MPEREKRPKPERKKRSELLLGTTPELPWVRIPPRFRVGTDPKEEIGLRVIDFADRLQQGKSLLATLASVNPYEVYDEVHTKLLPLLDGDENELQSFITQRHRQVRSRRSSPFLIGYLLDEWYAIQQLSHKNVLDKQVIASAKVPADRLLVAKRTPRGRVEDVLIWGGILADEFDKIEEL